MKLIPHGMLRRRLVFLLAAIVLVPIGIVVRRADEIPGNWPSSFLYEWFLMLLVLTIRPHRSFVWPTAAIVAGTTILLEFAQLWQPDWLMAIRGTWLGRMALGTTFTWQDLPPYPIACAVGAMILLHLWRPDRDERDSGVTPP
jgi:hypothetical protein